jgi:hypothetical protein
MSAALGAVDSAILSIAPGSMRGELADKIADLLAHPGGDQT